MFCNNYFPGRYFAHRYFPGVGAEAPPPTPTTGASGIAPHPIVRRLLRGEDRAETWTFSTRGLPAPDFGGSAVCLFIPAVRRPRSRRQEDEDRLLLAGVL